MTPIRPVTLTLMIMMTGCLLAGAALARSRPARDGASGFDPTAPLLAYLKKPDSSFSWSKVGEKAMSGGASLIELSLTSQTWQGIPWKHHLMVLKPKEMKPNPTPLLYITGSFKPTEAELFVGGVNAAKEPLFILYDIPNQPLFDDLHEDALIAYTFQKYLDTQDETWPLLFPMTKGAHRAMDAAQAFAKSEWKTDLPGFVVTGASKRGWTTYLTGATDPRVKGIAPMVYNNLNIAPQMKHQMEQWGQFSEQIEDYTRLGLQEKMTTPTGQKLTAMVDPYSFRKNLRLPKLLIHGTNDRYWTLDATRFYYDDLPGAKNLLDVPNSGHGLEDHNRLLDSLFAFWGAVSAGHALPAVKSSYDLNTAKDRLTLNVEPTGHPLEVRLWKATAPTGDFREVKWSFTPITGTDGRYTAALEKPASGFAAMFGEVQYMGENGETYTVSTPIHMIGR